MQYTEEQQLASLEEQNQSRISSSEKQDKLLNKDTAVADNSNTDTKTAALPDTKSLTDTTEKKTEKKGNKKKTEENAKTEEEPETMETMGSSNTFTRSFNEEAGLRWPVDGDILMKYSMEKSVYFKTLAQYKCNPAVIIGSSNGTSVYAAADCTITDISENEETGLTVTTSLDDRYNVIYGQLKNLTATVGDKLKEGDKLGEIADPTKYYVVEGSNLYLKVTENGETVDPLLLLR